MNSSQKAFSTLSRLDKLVSRDAKLRAQFMEGDYNYWHIYRSRTFFILRSYYKNKEVTIRNLDASNTFSFMRVIAGISALTYSLFSFLYTSIRRIEVLLFSLDNTLSEYHGDVHMRGIHKFLFERNIPFTESFPSAPPKKFFFNMGLRLRPAFYMESLTFLFLIGEMFGIIRPVTFFINASVFEEDEGIVRRIIEEHLRSVSESRFKIRILATLLEASPIKTLFAMDIPRYYGDIVAASSKAGVRVYAFQSAPLSRFETPWLDAQGGKGRIIKPEKFVAWSDYWKNEILSRGMYFTQDEIIVGGSTGGLPRMPHKQSSGTPPKRKAMGILLQYELGIPHMEVLPYIRNMLECEDMRIFFKVHPRIPIDEQKKIYGFDNISENVELVSSFNDMSRIDVVLGVHSSLLYEGIAWEKPVGVFDTSSDYADEMIGNGLAERISESDGSICDSIRMLAKISQEELRRRKERLFGEDPVDITSTLGSILKAHRIRGIA